MKSFALDNTGDLIIVNHELKMVEGDELIRQKVQEVINTNKGEWFLDWEQGIDFSNVLGKGVTEEMVKAEIEDGLQQVDEDLIISDFSMATVGRKLLIEFIAINENNGTEIAVSTEF